MHLTRYMRHKYRNHLTTLCRDHVPKKYGDSQNHSQQDLGLRKSGFRGTVAANTDQSVNKLPVSKPHTLLDSKYTKLSQYYNYNHNYEAIKLDIYAIKTHSLGLQALFLHVRTFKTSKQNSAIAKIVFKW